MLDVLKFTQVPAGAAQQLIRGLQQEHEDMRAILNASVLIDASSTGQVGRPREPS